MDILKLSKNTAVYANRDEENKRDQLAAIHLTITYQLYKDYVANNESTKMHQEMESIKKTKEEELNRDRISKNKNNL